jgi:hypothetical protein
VRLADLVIGGAIGAGLVALAAVLTRSLQVTDNFWLGLTTGLISSGLVVIVLGIIRAPDLTLDIGENADGHYQHGDFRFVQVRVSNNGLRIWRWQLRRPATLCRAELTFGDLRAAVGRFTIDARWSSLPEPVQQLPGGGAVLDAGAIFTRPREIINPADTAALNVAIKQQGIENCHAFNNRSYLFPNWSNPQWALELGTFWVRVRVVAAEVEAVAVFHLVNTGDQSTGLHLEPGPP